MDNHYIIRLKDTELWVDVAAVFSHADFKYFPRLMIDPLYVKRYSKYEEAEKFAKDHIPGGHWAIHKLIPQTELVGKPPEETFYVSQELGAPVAAVPVRLVEIDKGLVSKLRAWFT